MDGARQFNTMNPVNRSDTSSITIILAGMVLTTVIGAFYLINPSFISFFNYKSTDAMLSGSAPRPASGRIVIVDFDEETLTRYGQWPWPRNRLSHLLQKINDLGPKSIGLDLILSEPDRTSPKNWKAAIQHDLGSQIDIADLPTGMLDHDMKLAETLKSGPYVLGFEFLFEGIRDISRPCRLHPLNVVSVNSLSFSATENRFFKANQVVCNLDQLADSVSYSGFLNATPDSDGILRRIPLLMEYDNRIFPSLALAVLMQFGDVGQIQLIQNSFKDRLVMIADKAIPIDRFGNLAINFNSGAVPRVSAADVLNDRVESETLEDKMVLIGFSASGLEHIYQTPGNPVSTHVDVHAKTIETLLADNIIARQQEFLLWEAAFAMLITIGLGLSIARFGIAWNVVISVLCIIGVWQGMRILAQSHGLLFSPFLPTTVVISNFAILTILKTLKNQRWARQKTNDALVLLKTSENNLNSIIQTIPDIIFRLDASGRLTFLSPAIAKYKIRSKELAGRSILELVAPEDKQRAAYRINERRTGKRATSNLELRLLLYDRHFDEDEEPPCFSVSAEGIYRSEKPRSDAFMGTQGIIREITEHKKLESQLLQAKKLEVVGNLAAGIAHDLNNILSGLVSYPDLLLMELPADSPLREIIMTIQQSGEKAAVIVQDLLTLARRGVQASEIVDLNEIISAYLASPEFANTQNHHPGTSVETHCAPDLMGVNGSPVHLSKAIMNLLGNAAEAMPAGGRIFLTTRNSYLDVPLHTYEGIPEGEYVCLSVVDEGIGIAPKDLQRIFEPFYTKKMMQNSGTGLGMTVIWATVKDHAGYIDVQSKEGEGTRIDIYLPATRESADDTSRRVVLEDYIGDEHILVVDDIPEQLEIAVRMLEKLGYKISSVNSGEAAVGFLKEHSVDLMVLDMVMPLGMDGLETYRRVISMHPNQRAIIASGYSESERVKALQQLGAGAYIQKPYTLQKIGVAVRAELDRPFS
jgi:signal transduction histidine kinase/CHASE2 domain-containing sensor protein/CheY-like chemotaxis protein